MNQKSKPLLTEDQKRGLFLIIVTTVFVYMLIKGNKASFAKLTNASQPLMLLALTQIAKHSNMFESKSEIESEVEDEDED